MSIIAYANQEEYDVVHESQDCRGWTVTDQAGSAIGKVSDLLVDTDRMRVDSIVIDDKARISVEDISLREKKVIVRGVYDETAYADVNTGNYTTENGGKTYVALDDQSRYRGAGHVSGVTRAAENDRDLIIPMTED